MNGKREERLKSFQRFEKMNKILQIKGLGTLFTVFIISQNRTPRGCTRISIFMLFCYIIAKIQEGQEGGLLSLKDGIYKINNTKVRLIIFIKGLAILILPNSTSLPLLQLTTILGITSLKKSNDWIKTIVSWELKNYSLYLLVSGSSSSEASLTASLKYFILSALSTGKLLLGVSFIYFSTGSTHYESSKKGGKINMGGEDLRSWGFLLILFTFLFKLSAAPFYNWAPDLYDGLSMKTTKWMIIIPKIAVLSLKLSLMDGKRTDSLGIDLMAGSPFAAVLSLIIGSCALIQQWKIKRFLAYSGISNIGFILLASSEYSYILYFQIYAITTLNLFTIILAVQGREIHYIHQLTVFRYHPYLSIALALNLFSLAGRFVCFIF